MNNRNLLMFAGVALLFVATGVFQSWNLSLQILIIGVLSAIMALGVNMQEVHEGSYFPRNGKQYYYVETTIPGWGIGEIPEEWDGLPGVVIEVN